MNITQHEIDELEAKETDTEMNNRFRDDMDIEYNRVNNILKN